MKVLNSFFMLPMHAVGGRVPRAAHRARAHDALLLLATLRKSSWNPRCRWARFALIQRRFRYFHVHLGRHSETGPERSNFFRNLAVQKAELTKLLFPMKTLQNSYNKRTFQWACGEVPEHEFQQHLFFLTLKLPTFPLPTISIMRCWKINKSMKLCQAQ